MPISELARLTDWQLINLYAHPRDKDGAIKVPDENKEAAAKPSSESESLERDLRDLTVLAGMVRMPKAAYEAAAEKLKAKWAAKTEETSDGRVAGDDA